MIRIKSIAVGMIGCFLCFLSCGIAWAGSGGGVIPKDDEQTAIWAGVVVDYMETLRFELRNRDTGMPIKGVSIELFIPYIGEEGRYVLFGVTDKDGIYELDVAYVTDMEYPDENQFTTVDGDLKFQGSYLYLEDMQIKYRIYKANWLPYPHQGELVIADKEEPHVVEVYLYQNVRYGVSIEADGAAKPGEIILPFPWEGTGIGIDTIPKTGVEGAIGYWAAGLVFFLLAGGLLWYLQRDRKQFKERKEHTE